MSQEYDNKFVSENNIIEVKTQGSDTDTHERTNDVPLVFVSQFIPSHNMHVMSIVFCVHYILLYYLRLLHWYTGTIY